MRYIIYLIFIYFHSYFILYFSLLSLFILSLFHTQFMSIFSYHIKYEIAYLDNLFYLIIYFITESVETKEEHVFPFRIIYHY